MPVAGVIGARISSMRCKVQHNSMEQVTYVTLDLFFSWRTQRMHIGKLLSLQHIRSS